MKKDFALPLFAWVSIASLLGLALAFVFSL